MQNLLISELTCKSQGRQPGASKLQVAEGSFPHGKVFDVVASDSKMCRFATLDHHVLHALMRYAHRALQNSLSWECLRGMALQHP